MNQPDHPLTEEELARELAKSLENLKITARTVAHKAKVPVSEVEDWVAGRALPSVRAFARVVYVIPQLRYLKPRLIAAQQKNEPPKLPDPPPERRSFATQLTLCRTEDDLTQEEVANLLLVTGQAVSAWETGASLPVKMHHAALIDLWPSLADCLPAPVQDIDPPDGGAGLSRQLSSMRRVTPRSANAALAPGEPPAPAILLVPPPVFLREDSPPPPDRRPLVSPPEHTEVPMPNPSSVPEMSPQRPDVVVDSTNLGSWLDVLPLLIRPTLTMAEVLEILDLAERDHVTTRVLAGMIRRARAA